MPEGEADGLRIAVYFSPWRAIAKPTGVGQHIAHMTACLSESEQVSTSLLAARLDYQQARAALPPVLGELPVHYVPGPQRLMRAALLSSSWCPVDRWCEDVDWIYCPKEQPVLTRRARLAVTVHDVLAFEPPIAGLRRRPGLASRLRWKLLMRRILQRADLIAAVSGFTKCRLVDLLDVDESRIVVVGNGIAECYFSERRSDDAVRLQTFNLEPDRYLLTIGSLTYRKGGDLLLELAKRLQQTASPLRLVVAGRRHDKGLLRQYKQLKQQDAAFPVDLPGYVSDADQAVLARNARAFLFPSRYEGFGIPVLEAMAAGTPVICSRAGALPEVAGDAAMYAESFHPNEWLERIRLLCDSSTERATLIRAGRERAVGQTWQRCAARLLDAMVRHSRRSSGATQ